MERKLKVTTTLKKQGNDKIETHEIFMVITNHDNIELLIQMAYGNWYDILEYKYEPIEIFVSENYCNEITTNVLKRL